jgi:hypothetical protein
LKKRKDSSERKNVSGKSNTQILSFL